MQMNARLYLRTEGLLSDLSDFSFGVLPTFRSFLDVYVWQLNIYHSVTCVWKYILKKTKTQQRRNC